MKKWINKQTILAFILGALLFSGTVGATTYYQFTLSTDSLYVAGIKADKPMYKLNGTNYVPLRNAAEILGSDVQYKNGRADIIPPKTDLETVVANCKNSCVMIYVYKDGQAVMRGSGFVYNSYIITAKHVTDAGDKYVIFMDDSINGMLGTKVDIDTDLDVSVLSINYILPSVTLGDSDKLIEGQKLVAITSPSGNKNSVDECLYSGEGFNSGKYYVGISETEMEGGSSGGAVFNLQSEMIGMDVMGSNGQDKAIKINDLKPIFEKLK